MKPLYALLGVAVLAILVGVGPVIGPTGTWVLLVVVFTCGICWFNRSRRPREAGFRYVYVNDDGSARELTNEEQEYLDQEFQPADGGRPYIKSRYESRDGWGNLSGFIERQKVPVRIAIVPVDPTIDVEQEDKASDPRAIYLAAGDIVTENPDGSFTCEPNPDIPAEERFERMRKFQREQVLAREAKIRGSASGSDAHRRDP